MHAIYATTITSPWLEGHVLHRALFLLRSIACYVLQSNHLGLRDEERAALVVRAHTGSAVDHLLTWQDRDYGDKMGMIIIMSWSEEMFKIAGYS